MPMPSTKLAPVPISFGPCCAQIPLLRVNTHAAPMVAKLSLGPPTTTVLPSADSATETAPLALNSCACWVHTPLLRVNAQAVRSFGPAISAVLPSPESATDQPCCEFADAPVPTSFCPCCIQAPLLRVKTHAAPVAWSFCKLSSGPPTRAVLPSDDSATDHPCRAPPATPTAPVPTSFGPCCANCADTGCGPQISAAKITTDTMALATGEKQLSRDAAATANPLAQAKSTSIMTSPC